MDKGKNKTKQLNLIKKQLINEFGDQILSAVVYGSTLGDDYCKYSDYDILLIFDRIDFDTYKRLRNVKKSLNEQGLVIDFNSHTYSELPKERKEVFWHNNRSVYMQKELALYGKVLFGENYFRDLELDHHEMLVEAVKVISSLNYQIRKTLTNMELNLKNRIIIMKWCIYSVMYFLAATNTFPQNKREALELFNSKYHPPINPIMFLNLKTRRPEEISESNLKDAFDFLSYMENLVYDLYKKETRYGV